MSETDGERAKTAGRRELLPIAALGMAAAGALGFIWLADAVGEGSTHALDTHLLLALREPGDPGNPIGPAWLEETARDITALGSNGVLALAVVTGCLFLFLSHRPRTAVLLLLASGGGLLLVGMLKELFERARPDLVPHAARVFTSSFPSSHAVMSAIVYLTLGALLARAQPDRRLKIFFALLAVTLTLLVGSSRVYLGVHWPTDVLAGWCIGTAWAAAFWALAGWLQWRRARDGAREVTGERAREDDDRSLHS
ncbi:MAG: phosphatase PAP2 family protein [Rhodospirillales bacterium]